MANVYSVLLPTYNEKANLPVIVYLLAKTFKEACVVFEALKADAS